MKKCPFCAEEIQDEAVKCKHCGEFLDSTPSKASPKKRIPKSQPSVEPVFEPDPEGDLPVAITNFPCAFCGSLSCCPATQRDIDSGDGGLTCSKCSRESLFSVRKVRSKSSKQQSQHRQIVGRQLSFRVRKLTGEEEHIEFESGGPDLEAKSGDLVAFLSWGQGIRAVANYTVGTVMMMALPIDLEIDRLEKELAAIKSGPIGQGCGGGCLLGLLGIIMSAVLNTPGNGDVANVVGYAALAAPVAGPFIASSVAQAKPENIAKTKELETEIAHLKSIKAS